MKKLVSMQLLLRGHLKYADLSHLVLLHAHSITFSTRSSGQLAATGNLIHISGLCELQYGIVPCLQELMLLQQRSPWLGKSIFAEAPE